MRTLIETDSDLQRLQDELLRFIRNEENSGVANLRALLKRINVELVGELPDRNDVAFLVWRDRLVLTAAYYYGIANDFNASDLATIIGRLDDIGFRAAGDWISFRGAMIAALRSEGRDREADNVKSKFYAHYENVQKQLEDAIQQFRLE